jgi:hypothetical protein
MRMKEALLISYDQRYIQLVKDDTAIEVHVTITY